MPSQLGLKLHVAKILLIWRYFRFWSLINGIEAPENMPKCINNCYNLENFWKNWHASFKKWLVRYMYIPLGGSQKKLLNIWVHLAYDLEWLKVLSENIYFASSVLMVQSQLLVSWWQILLVLLLDQEGINWLLSSFLHKEEDCCSRWDVFNSLRWNQAYVLYRRSKAKIALNWDNDLIILSPQSPAIDRMAMAGLEPGIRQGIFTIQSPLIPDLEAEQASEQIEILLVP
ncbi:hypothetical protein L6164_026853 [Bauhinia variegata]|uniref:Uncharacterized protein n=1 Tax=Bauhinia variegata TaxID=167791 RepID=A0ACB9LRQ7_BAUVA|nr:hypothetical protein L6164_026853 [Bauhinia variegata]